MEEIWKDIDGWNGLYQVSNAYQKALIDFGIRNKYVKAA